MRDPKYAAPEFPATACHVPDCGQVRCDICTERLTCLGLEPAVTCPAHRHCTDCDRDNPCRDCATARREAA